MRSTLFFAQVLSLVLIAPPIQAAEWPQFRGPDAGGVAEDAELPGLWSPETQVHWKVQVPGAGWSCPVVWMDKIFVTTAVTENQAKPSQTRGGGGRGGFGGFGGGGPPDVMYRWEVHCLDRATGETLWMQVAIEQKPTIATHRTNTYASETPVTDGERVYAYFGMTGLFCYDLAGNLIWKKDLGSYSMMLGWGTGSSPALEGELLFIQCDNEEESFLAAFDKRTGDEKWRVKREEKSSWSTPFVWRNKARTELVVLGSTVRSHDPATGDVLWELAGMNGRCNASPVADAETIYFGGGGFGGGGRGFGGRPGGQGGGGQGGGRGGVPLVAVRAGAAGKISLDVAGGESSFIAWNKASGGPSMASPLLYGGHLYILDQRAGFLTCLDAATGEERYRERVSDTQGFTASPWASKDRIFCLDADGQTHVVKAGPAFERLAENRLDEMCWSTPAVAGDHLLIRTVDNLYCFKP